MKGCAQWKIKLQPFGKGGLVIVVHPLTLCLVHLELPQVLTITEPALQI